MTFDEVLQLEYFEYGIRRRGRKLQFKYLTPCKMIYAGGFYNPEWVYKNAILIEEDLLADDWEVEIIRLSEDVEEKPDRKYIKSYWV